MKSRMCALSIFLCAASSVAQYKDALPGYRYEFPRDYFNHPQYQTEWWYYTGNLKSQDGHRYGYELTFFRQGVNRDGQAKGTWDIDDLYIAHLALSDLDGGKFIHAERANRAGPGLAGISEPNRRIWNGNWQVVWDGDDQVLQAVEERVSLKFILRSMKPPVIHGKNGVSQKGEGLGRASHYISLTRLETTGEVQLGVRNFQVTGTSWMDHEFFTHQLDAEQAGWDWASIQLEDNTELMLFRIRRKDGSVDRFSAGTFVDSHGGTAHLDRDDFTLLPVGPVWTSPSTHAPYPLRWKILVRKLGISLESSTSSPSQEIPSKGMLPSYWEGAVSFEGQEQSTPIRGVGYIEMTGYDRAVVALR